jgi:hypothetical protein
LRLNVSIARRYRRRQLQNSNHHQDYRPGVSKIKVSAAHLVQQKQNADRYHHRWPR